jgi:hypothetical protein
VTVRDTDRGYAKRLKAIAEAAAGPTVTKIGVLGDKADKAHGDSGLTVGELATIHEFGLGVPERSFIRAWFDQERPAILEALRAAHKQVLLGKLTPQRAGEVLGMRWAGQVQKFISDGRVKPELAEATIKAKGSSVPLIDSGQLRSAITWLVETRLSVAKR